MQAPGEELLGKFWDTLADKGIGKLFTPWQIRREARAHAEARAHELRLLAQAEADADDLRAGRKRLHKDGVTLLPGPSEPHLVEHDGRIEPTLSVAEFAAIGAAQNAANAARSEINASRAVLFAEETLTRTAQDGPRAAASSGQTIDDDWLFNWREHVGKVSNEDLQRLWGSVLAGEFVNPGQYSLRTLDFLRTLSKSEAELISKLGPLASGNRIFRTASDYLRTAGLHFNALLKLQQLGILSGVEALGMEAIVETAIPGRFIQALAIGNKALIIERESPEPPLRFATYLVTDLGMQILSLGSFAPDIEYMKIGGKDIVTKGFTVSLADWVQDTPDSGHFFNAVRLD